MPFNFDPILMQVYRTPTITAYNRLESRPRHTNFDRSLKAEVRDAMWMLTRQWQTGEFWADDAGSAVKIKLLTGKSEINEYALGDNKSESYNHNIPLETLVEQEAIPINLQLRIEMGHYFISVLKEDGLENYRISVLSQYNITDTITAEEIKEIEKEKESLHNFTLLGNRVIDGYKIIEDVKSAAFDTWVDGETTINAGDKVKVKEAAIELQNHYIRLYAQPESVEESAWEPSQLEYKFAVSAEKSSSQKLIMSADQYYQGKLDWHSFQYDTKRTLLPKQQIRESGELEECISFIPTPVVFKGMPKQRFWEMEEQETNFGNIDASTTGLLSMLLAEFGLVYGNDWVVFPYTIPVNTLCRVKGIIVTDVFGEKTIIRRAGEGLDNDWQRWAMFYVNNKSGLGEANKYLFLPPTLTNYLESKPIEKVNFIRDEMANMAWAIEEIIPGQTGKGMQGKEYAIQNDPVLEEGSSELADVDYTLGTSVPSNWIPFMPVHIPGSTNEIEFQRAKMPDIEEGIGPLVKARGRLLNEVSGKYVLKEEEIPKAGVSITRTYQRTRWFDGKTYLWIGRRKETGRGQGASRLQFDRISDV